MTFCQEKSWSNFSSYSDNQGNLSAWWPEGDLQPGGWDGPRNQHASSFLPLPQPGRWLCVHPGVRATGLWDHPLFLSQGASTERGCSASCSFHHGLCQYYRYDLEQLSLFFDMKLKLSDLISLLACFIKILTLSVQI